MGLMHIVFPWNDSRYELDELYFKRDTWTRRLQDSLYVNKIFLEHRKVAVLEFNLL